MKIGLRTLKTGIAVTIGLFAVSLLELESPFFITIAALIGMQPTIADSWVIGRNRIMGTFIGAVFGLILALWLPSHPIIAGLGILALIRLINAIKTPEAVIISCIVFVAVFMESEGNAVAYAMSRLFDTAIGLGIALVVNYFVLPPTYDRKALKEIKKTAPEIFRCQNRLLGVVMRKEHRSLEDIQSDMEKIDEALTETKKLVDLQEKEEKIHVYGDMNIKEIMLIYRLISEMNQHLQNLMGIVEKGISLSIMQPMEKELAFIYNELLAGEKLLANANVGTSQKLEAIEEKVNMMKKRIKNQETDVPLSVEETIKLLVVLYNVEEILSKTSIIFNYEERSK